MTFGKYRGCHLSEIPTSYLAWVWDADFTNDELREAVRREILERVSGGDPIAGGVVTDRRHLQRIYRTLAIEHHPDHGGNNDIMTGINLLYEALQ